MEERSEHQASHPSSDEESVSNGTDYDFATDSQGQGDEDADALILDPNTSERHQWRDIRTKIEREIWCPGDGDGDRSTDYWDRVGPLKSIEDRWKLYQLSLGPIKYEHNEPPKYVILDDRACYEIIKSNIPRASLGKFWPHDFGMSGKLRDRRPHRGRGSVGDPDAEGNDQYDYIPVGIKNARYYFTGEKDYTPIIYRSEELSAEIAKKLEKKRKGWSVRNTEGDPKSRGHNQFTPKDWLVKNGAASKSNSKKKKKKSVADHKVPEWLLDKPKQTDELATSQATAQTSGNGPTQAEAALQQWAGNHDPNGAAESQTKKRRLEGDTKLAHEELSSSPNQMFPFHRQTAEHQLIPPNLYNPLAPIGNGSHQESTCPYTESRTYASQLEKDLATAHDVISEQKDKITELEDAGAEKERLVEELRRELQDLRWSDFPMRQD